MRATSFAQRRTTSCEQTVWMFSGAEAHSVRLLRSSGGCKVQRTAKGASGKGPRQKKNLKVSKVFFDIFRAAPILWPFLGGSEKFDAKWGCLISGTRAQTKTFGSGYLLVRCFLFACEGAGAKKFGMSLETQETKLLGGMSWNFGRDS